MESYENWREEKRSAYLYTILAQNETNILHKKLFVDLNDAAEKQAELWAKKAKEAGNNQPLIYVPDVRTRMVAWLIKIMGAERLHSILSAMKIRGMSIFTRYHSEHQHTSLNASNNLRAAVFGVSDGLVSNMSLILGITGASVDQHFVILAAIAGTLAGACSMGAGEYISVRSQREVFEYQIAIEKQELAEYPEEEAEELSLIYQARGVSKEDADKIAQLMIANPETGLNALAREELGINPEELVSPIGAMLSSFFSFGIGALVPVIPFLLGNFRWNIYISMAVTGLALFSIGTILSLFTNKNPIMQGLRMLTIGVIAGVLTFGIGRLVGVSMY